ncbi:cell division regulator GpsB [Ureibacillus composti]|uniref:Cell division regulator GpsB n=1 Tax=Lysinibacillus composti TaxID=720633 RepID=A0A3N9UDG0_9BACI|nr:cell division regulator GpsB [Lysinibacillus composti]MBM7609330.1 DivIVA domain-containing protein [Lysinibacillus composti]MDM5333372.1 cell division regulator GpsB [Ureibacillus composti]RQW74275.1 cell division regulator GpsB [Lysinibacillus composti]
MEIKLNSKIIYEKEFKKAIKGYSVDEVDQFLDQVLEDYDVFEQVVEQLKAENKRLKEELENANRKPQAAPSSGNTNFDILKRLSKLEKEVFGSRLYE